MAIVTYVIVILFGAALGSFLNVCIDRLPKDGSLLKPSSRCDNCGRRLSALEMVPVLSYICLHGRCHTCGARIPLRVPVVEGLTALIVALAWWRYGLAPAFFITVLWSAVFILIIFIDAEHQLILNKVTYPAAIIAIALLTADWLAPRVGLLANLRVFGNVGMIPVNSLVSGLLAAGIFFVFFLIIYLINPAGMGMGDIKLVTLIGLVTGFPVALVAIFIGIILGGIAAIFMLITRKKGRKDIMPYGVFLGIGPIIAMLWGANIFNWYLG